jgi:3-isopropylmalate/(R)-2-methylmalate dehydratase small subunit
MPKVVFVCGDDVSTDVIYPGRYMATVLPSETPQFAFADNPEFNTMLRTGAVPPGSIIVGGKNFGCGSSREQAVSTLRGYDLVVVAESFARIFLQNSINLGLQLVTAPGISASPGDELVLAEGAIENVTDGKTFPVKKLPAARQSIIDAGGLIPYTRKLLLERAGIS